MMNGSKYLLILLVLAAITSCVNTHRYIRPQYTPTYKAVDLFDNKEPAITVSEFYDGRARSYEVGTSYNGLGEPSMSWQSEVTPAVVLENAIIEQLKNSGFYVIRTRGWELNPKYIPEGIRTKYLVTGKLKAFQVEARGFYSITINSEVVYDLLLYDVEAKKVVYEKQLSGQSEDKLGFFRALAGPESPDDMQKSIGNSLSKAVDSAFQDDAFREMLMKTAPD